MLWVSLLGYRKTSLGKAIMHKFSFAIYTFVLRDFTLTDSEIMIMYLSIRPKAIAVFDNINRVKIGEKKVIINSLLKLLDRFIRQGQTFLKILICNN
jgi:hypothetical protein